MKLFRTQVEGAEPSIHTHYLYDAAGVRVKKLVRRQGGAVETTVYIDGIFEHHARSGVENNSLHVMDNQQRLALVRAGSSFPDDATPAVKFHLGDHQGSSRVAIDNSGAFINREEYSPYGETGFGSFARKRYRFTGKEQDEESGLYYHGARYYAPWLGRWVSPDPLGLIDGFNLYWFLRNNPLRYLDPSGTYARPPYLEKNEEAEAEYNQKRKGNLFQTMKFGQNLGEFWTMFEKSLGVETKNTRSGSSFKQDLKDTLGFMITGHHYVGVNGIAGDFNYVNLNKVFGREQYEQPAFGIASGCNFLSTRKFSGKESSLEFFREKFPNSVLVGYTRPASTFHQWRLFGEFARVLALQVSSIGELPGGGAGRKEAIKMMVYTAWEQAINNSVDLLEDPATDNKTRKELKQVLRGGPGYFLPVPGTNGGILRYLNQSKGTYHWTTKLIGDTTAVDAIEYLDYLEQRRSELLSPHSVEKFRTE
jgi:RHS repeat-associated protein